MQQRGQQAEQAPFKGEMILRAQSKPYINFKYAFEEVFIQTLIDRMKDNEEFLTRLWRTMNLKPM